ncbi:cupin domain-containing protein [Pedobacter duraquae]|uniref:Cupin domain-containing protein n=1 Tax=Pedobacter duraquae TaxID=425511 RepID=A0A4V3C3A1_9SPHI|nr:cupin domain-containing protein [Pedobacter duraquae]TDO21279.1 Cupin domain-containing protein [Pedobacter duraquae]
MMKRRNFVLATMLAIPATAFSKLGKFIKINKAKKAFIVKANESRFDGIQTTTPDAIGRCVVSGADTQGELLIVAPTSKTFAFKGGPPLHIHKNQDEVFYVANGEFLVQLGDVVHKVSTGDTVFIPRGTPHTYANPIENNPGSIISIHQPVGKNEEFFKYLCTYGKMPEKEIDPDSPVVGPPIEVN